MVLGCEGLGYTRQIGAALPAGGWAKLKPTGLYWGRGEQCGGLSAAECIPYPTDIFISIRRTLGVAVCVYMVCVCIYIYMLYI